MGGVKAERLKFSEYETSVEVVNEFGESKCPLYIDKTEKREGAAGAFFGGSTHTSKIRIYLDDIYFITIYASR